MTVACGSVRAGLQHCVLYYRRRNRGQLLRMQMSESIVVSGPKDSVCSVSLKQPHEKNGPVLLQNMALTAVAQKPPDGLKQAHERNGPVLLQNVAPTPLGTHEHSRVHFFKLGSPGLVVLGPKA